MSENSQKATLSEAAASASRFASSIHQALRVLSDIDKAPDSLKASMRDDALAIIAQCKQDAMQPVTGFSAIAEAFDALSDGVAKLELPDASPSGLGYKSPIPREGFSTRAYNCLTSSNINTVGELCALEIADMMKFRNFGRKSLDEIEAFRKQLGVPFPEVKRGR